MKHKLIFFIFVVITILNVNGFGQYPDSLIQALANQTNLDTLTYYVNALSGEDSVTINGQRHLILSRYYNHPDNDLAADFIFETLQNTGLGVTNQNFSTNGRNIIAVQTGSLFPDQKFIICAHYDDMPSFPPAPGADDNASGTAAVLEAARILSQATTPYSVIYALWDEEEIGLVGSNYYAQQAAAGGENILGVVNLEMFGWDGNDDSQFEIHTRPIANSIQLANIIQSLPGIYSIGLFPITHNPGTTASDHSSFWNQGYTALVFTQAFFAGDPNPYYHTANDLISHFNLAYFYAMSKLAVTSMAHLAHYEMVLDLKKPEEFQISGIELKQNYPNPFNPSTKIDFYLPNAEWVSLRVFNVLGEQVATLLSGSLTAGNHSKTWNAGNFPSGIYLYQLTANGFTESRKMILME